ncbi:LysE family translocator [Porticoccaceae bacterium]|nr:LysE family translocator [Porticoccaceae bacterium]
MEIATYLSFIAISFGFIAAPGPNVLVVISTSLSHGKVKGFMTTIGVSLAMALQLSIAALGTSWLVNTLAQGFHWIKWIGVAYLLYLGVSNIMAAISKNQIPQEPTDTVSFSRGFFVSLTNPKTIIFFGAFLPQFVSSTDSFKIQIVILSITFWFLAILVNIIYTLISSRISTVIRSNILHKATQGLSGILYLGAGSILAVTKRV